MILFGNCDCPKCELETRMMIEIENDKDDFLLIGSSVDWGRDVSHLGLCDYCQSSFRVHIVVINNVISAFLSSDQYAAYQQGEFQVVQASEGKGLQLEAQGESAQFHESFTSPYAEHPYGEGDCFTIKGKEWFVQRVFKKENNERDVVNRMMKLSLDEYWYEVQDEHHHKKWLIVTDVEEHNALLMQESPFLKENEVKHDVTDTLYQTQKIYEEQMSEHFRFEAFQYLCGVRVFVYNQYDEIELDVMEDTVEDALMTAQEILAESVE